MVQYCKNRINARTKNSQMSNISYGALRIRPLKIEDRELFYRHGSISFCNFTNIFSWRHAMNYSVADIDGFPALVGKYRGHSFNVLPPFYGDGMSAAELLLKVKVRLGVDRVRMFPMTPDMLPEIRNELPSADIVLSRSLSDYIYKTSDLIALSGKRYHQKRNHLNSFLSKYEHEYFPVHKDDAQSKELLRRAAEHLYEPSGDEDLEEEQAVIRELLDNFDALGLVGAVICCDGEPIAYSIGEKMSENTALIHIEKANRDFSGAYAAINNLFLKNEFADTEFVNREEDMGIEGLRKAKLSYRPVSLGEYYTVTI